MNYINEISKKVNLKESKKIVEQFLINLYIHQTMSTKALSHKLILPIPIVTAIKKEFIKLGVVVQRNGIALTDVGMKYVEEDMKYAGLDVDLYIALLSNDGIRERYIEKLESQINKIYEERPQVNVTLDQAFGTAETAIKRAILCLQNNTLIGKAVLCVGDDDLVSIAISFLLLDLFPGNKQIKSRIVVFDVDKQLTQYILNVGKKYKFSIECHEINLKEPLPLKFLNVFDCFLTDPPYTQEGMILFLSRGIGALKQEKGNSIFLSYGKKPLEENFKVQEEIINHGLSIKNIKDSFNEYHGASLLGNQSQMFILETTESTKTLINPDFKYTKPIYTREINPLERHYKCKKCGHLILMSTKGGTKFKTIEQLKDEGCPECGNASFDLLNKSKNNQLSDKKESLGLHVIADFFECSEEVIKSTKLIRNYMINAAKKANATIVSEGFNSFNPWGVSGVIVIKESHITIHTWPEYRYAAVDLFTCGTSLELMEALNYLKEKLECKNMECSSLLRGLFQGNHITSTIEMKE